MAAEAEASGHDNGSHFGPLALARPILAQAASSLDVAESRNGASLRWLAEYVISPIHLAASFVVLW